MKSRLPTRRSFLAHSAVALAAMRSTLAHSAASGPLAQVAEGTLGGQSNGTVQVFRGVPFARPPVGPLRFRPPQPPAPWKGVRPALEFAAASVQPNEPDLNQSEDCLYLNVWAPQRAGTYPVFVWIHGGGFTGGHSFERLFDGTAFARSGVVLITVAYRLGALGFLDVSPALGASYAGSADNALRDLLAALTWVQRNAHAFGGDPARVTVGGESAGAKLTDMLLGIPAAQPLFHQAISESGGAERIWPLNKAQEVGAGFAKLWSTQTGSPATDLRSAPARQIVDIQSAFMKSWPAHFPLRAELDPTLIPQLPLRAIQGGSSRGKRLLLGTNRDESALFLGPHPQGPVTAQDLGNLPLGTFDAIAARYAEIYPDMPPDLRRIRAVTAEEYWIPSIRVVDAHLHGGGGESFVYRLDMPGRGRFRGLAFHSEDLRYVWDFFGKEMPTSAEQTLATEIHTAWVSFLQGHAPAAPGLPAWPPYALPSRPTMLLDENSTVAQNPAGAELTLWNGQLMP